jgi:CRISPR-associated endonuclease/helicase Cas3
MRAQDFARFYRAVHERDPFPWQTELAVALCENRWPGGIHVPTGCGKTCALDAFVFALACREGLEFPRRLFYVIDRRVVVDDILAHARKLARAVCRAPIDRGAAKILMEVAKGLAALSHGGIPLVACGMRGGARLEVDWAYAPDQPALIVSTIDQTGSRLLFRGYGAAPAAWPIHAGLVGCDSALVLDEAHLSQPFGETLAWLPRAARAERVVAQAPRRLELTATPRTNHGEVLELSEADRALPEIQQRTGRPKLATLREVPMAGFAREAAGAAELFLRADGVRVVGVIVNRVALAREIFEDLRRRSGAEVFLLTGRIRPLDRDRLLGRLLPRCHSHRDRATPQPPTVVVATQTIEVGADLDFDVLVTQSAPLPALRQRFGRLNRLGMRESAEALILHAELEERSRKEPDPVYGHDLAAHWEWLQKAAKTMPKPKAGKRGSPAAMPARIDFASAAWTGFARRHGGEPAVEPRRAPVFLPAHARMLAHTSPTPEPDVEPQVWLHGVQSGPADVFVCWRADLDGTHRAAWPEIVSTMPPRRGELLAVPFGAFRRWLARGEFDRQATDAEGAQTTSRDDPTQFVLRWDGENSDVVEARRIRPGATVVVPASMGGSDEFGFNPAARPATDLAEAALAAVLKARGNTEFTCRLHPALVRPESLAHGWFAETLERYEAADEPTTQELLPALAAVLGPQGSGVLEGILTEFSARSPEMELTAYPAERPEGLLVRFESRSLSVCDEEDTDADDAPPLRTPRRLISITDHSDRVAARAVEYARRCGLPVSLQRTLELAARGHDLGKLAPHVQRQMRAGAEDLAPGVPLAKSPPGVHFTASEFPGWRHEALSAALLTGLDGAALPGSDVELVRYLAGASHGRGRPFFLPATLPPHAPVAAMLEGQMLQADAQHGLDAVGAGWAGLWHTLADRYGMWGLAWLEAILRLADHRVSEEESG